MTAHTRVAATKSAVTCDRRYPARASHSVIQRSCPAGRATPGEAATAHGLRVKLHAEQLTDQGGAALAARFAALSADHLEQLTPAGIAAG